MEARDSPVHGRGKQQLIDEKVQKNLIGLLGLASKSGKIVVGQKVLKSYISGYQKKKVVFFSCDHGESVDQMVKKCETRKVPHFTLTIDKRTLGGILGRAEVSAVGISEESFVDGFMKILGKV